ncbi:hypothetical protein CLV51_102129 [Chitinophaga niastensis]|uniref:Uncharacterized protein n=1 Tax=Chitinophaga niastensis TaxID=536980 RepID=A0A2P8HM39_CHINA|nr:hypothetical protein [Chitinophaga niastensis]PSL47284.1 hypothetical protein CLV51_102129 [Chitinophaga niastensis]
MKLIYPGLAAALCLSSCITDPPTEPITSKEMRYQETFCNNPWGKAQTTTIDTIAAFLAARKINGTHLNLYGKVFDGVTIPNANCDTLTGRLVTFQVFFADTAKARSVGFYNF